MAKVKNNTTTIETQVATGSENHVSEGTNTQTQLAFVSDEQNVLTSKRYIKGHLEFLSPHQTLNTIVDLFRPLNCEIIVTGSHDNTNGNTEDNRLNVAYGRTMVTVRREIDTELFYEMGIMYALDLVVPKVKIFRGAKVRACLNQCVFGADDLQTMNLAHGKENELIAGYVSTFIEHTNKVIQRITELKAIRMNEEQIIKAIGTMMVTTVRDKKSTGTTAIMRAIELLYRTDSKYYHKQPEFSAWTLYNALTEYFDKKVNFFDIPEKAYDTYKLIEVVAG